MASLRPEYADHPLVRKCRQLAKAIKKEHPDRKHNHCLIEAAQSMGYDDYHDLIRNVKKLVDEKVKHYG